MRHETTFLFSAVILFAAILPLRAADLKNSGFEEQGGWKIITQGSNFQPAFDNDVSQTGQKSFVA